MEQVLRELLAVLGGECADLGDVSVVDKHGARGPRLCTTRFIRIFDNLQLPRVGECGIGLLATARFSLRHEIYEPDLELSDLIFALITNQHERIFVMERLNEVLTARDCNAYYRGGLVRDSNFVGQV